MAIAAPESGWQKFKRTTAIFDLGSAVVTAGSLLVSSAGFFATGSYRWAAVVVGLAVLVFVLQGFKARRVYRDQSRKDSVHELLGCLHTLETVLLGPDLEPAKRAAAGLRLTVHVPDASGSLLQATDYVGDQRTPRALGEEAESVHHVMACGSDRERRLR